MTEKKKAYKKQYDIEHKKEKAVYDKLYRKKNSINIAKKKHKYYLGNKKHISNKSRVYHKNNKERQNRLCLERYYGIKDTEEFKIKSRINCAKYRAKKLLATPAYVNQHEINKIYRIAHILAKMTGEEFHVDHIIPLNNRLICGLHHQDNLQIISKERNLSKSNKFKPIIIDY